jgi:hypothetical protein
MKNDQKIDASAQIKEDFENILDGGEMKNQWR